MTKTHGKKRGAADSAFPTTRTHPGSTFSSIHDSDEVWDSSRWRTRSVLLFPGDFIVIFFKDQALSFKPVSVNWCWVHFLLEVRHKRCSQAEQFTGTSPWQPQLVNLRYVFNLSLFFLHNSCLVDISQCWHIQCAIHIEFRKRKDRNFWVQLAWCVEVYTVQMGAYVHQHKLLTLAYLHKHIYSSHLGFFHVTFGFLV